MQRTVHANDRVNVCIAELGTVMDVVEWAEVLLNFATGSLGVAIYSDNMPVLQAITSPTH